MGNLEYKKSTLPACVLCISTLISGCVVFPSEFAEEEPFQSEDLEFLRVGASKHEIQEVLGNRFRSYDDGQYWLFVADRAMTQWNVLVVVPQNPWSGPLSRNERKYSLILRFDQNDAVQTIIKVDDRSPCNDDKSLCHTEDVLHVLEDDEHALSGILTECKLSMYLEKSGEGLERQWIIIDKVPLPIVLSEAYYSRRYVAVGRHTVSLQDVRQDVECRSGQSIFLRLRFDGTGGYSMNPVEPAIAHQDLLNRRLSLIPDSRVMEAGPPN